MSPSTANNEISGVGLASGDAFDWRLAGPFAGGPLFSAVNSSHSQYCADSELLAARAPDTDGMHAHAHARLLPCAASQRQPDAAAQPWQACWCRRMQICDGRVPHELDSTRAP